jgi:DNA-binding phage protein
MHDLAARVHQKDAKNPSGGPRSRHQAKDGVELMAKTGKAGMSDETFDDFLAEQGLLEATEDHAIKELIAKQLAAAMQEQGLSKVAMAARMKTSRRQLDRLLDPKVPSVTLDTLRRAASAVGRSLRIELI